MRGEDTGAPLVVPLPRERVDPAAVPTYFISLSGPPSRPLAPPGNEAALGRRCGAFLRRSAVVVVVLPPLLSSSLDEGANPTGDGELLCSSLPLALLLLLLPLLLALPLPDDGGMVDDDAGGYWAVASVPARVVLEKPRRCLFLYESVSPPV